MNQTIQVISQSASVHRESQPEAKLILSRSIFTRFDIKDLAMSLPQHDYNRGEEDDLVLSLLK